MPPDPPRRMTLGRLTVTEVDARRPPFSRPPPPDIIPGPTVRPPAFAPQPIPREYQRQPLPAPPARREPEHEPTLVGPVGAQESDNGDRPSTVQAMASAEKLAAELAVRNRELAAERAEKAALQRNLEAAKRAPVFTGPTEKQLRKAALHAAILKVLAALAACLVAVTTYLSVHTSATVPTQIENADAKQKAIASAADADHDALVALREFVRADLARRDCVEAQMASALLRGTGHRVTGISDGVEWLEQRLTTKRPPLLWERAAYYPTSPCAAEPKPP